MNQIESGAQEVVADTVEAVYRIKRASLKNQTLPMAAINAAIIQMYCNGIAQKRIAQVLGVSTKKVAKIVKTAKPGTEIVEAGLMSYRMLVHKHVPIAKKARRLGELVDDTDGSVALKALKRADEIVGLEALINPKGEPPGEQESRPLFSLPAGSKVNVTMTVSAGNEIDITPK